MKVGRLSVVASISCVLAFASVSALAAPDLPGNIKGFRKDTIEVYFNRADQERASDSWERVARFGAETAISQWEREAANLYVQPNQMAQARNQLSSWVGAELQERYESWLTRRFFDRQGSLGSEAVLRAITDANLQYLYTTDASGKIVLDESGDPILRDSAGLQADREGWKARVSSAADEVLAAWDRKVDAAFAPELGGLIGPEALSKYSEYKIGLRAGLRREMERAALQGELSLAVRRLYDQYSLRKKSESATADAVAAQIVKETRAQTDEGIAQIKAGLDHVPESVDSRAPSIDTQQWLESFKAAFDKGLSKWDAAEEKFLVSRMEWERDAGKTYQEGEGAWASAFQRLKTERRGWEQQVDTLLKGGSARWEQARGELSAAIESARGEFKKECDERVAGMSDQVGALVDMYAQSLQVVSTSVSSGQELIKKLGIKDANGEYVRFSKDAVPAIAAWRRQTWAGYINSLNAEIANLNAQRASIQKKLEPYSQYIPWPGGIWDVFYPIGKATIAGLQSDLQSTDSQIAARTSLVNQMRPLDAGATVQAKSAALDSALVQYENFLSQKDGNSTQADAIRTAWERASRMGDWLTMIDTYTASADTAKKSLEGTLGRAFGTDATDLRNVLVANGDSGVAYLDEYQLELLRAKAVQDYWTQRKAVADEVVAYAQDISSGRATQDEGARKYAAARSAYDAQLAQYQQVLARLTAGGADLSAARKAMERAQQATDAAAADYEEARSRYLEALLSTQSGTVDFYRGQIKQRYADLLAASGMSGTDTELSDATVQYFAAARRHGVDLAVEGAWGRASVLVKGDPESGLASLAELKETAGRINTPASADLIPSTLEALGVAISAPDHTTVSALFAGWRDAQAGQEKELAGWKLIQYMRISAAKADAAYKERLAQATAYGAVDATAWYEESGGKLTAGSLDDRLSADSAAAVLSLIVARARVEIRGLDAWVQLKDGQTPADQDALMLALSAQQGLTREEARERAAGLGSLLAALEGAAGDVTAGIARLRQMTSEGGFIQAFASGQGTFVDEQAGDLGLGLCGDQFREAERARRLATAWQGAASDSLALESERESAALSSIRKVFADSGLSLGSSGMLPASEDLAVAVKGRSAAEAASFVAALGQQLQEAASAGPQWLGDRISEYCSALAGYAAAEAVRAGSGPSAASRAAAAETSAAAASAEVDDLQTVGGELQGEGRYAALVGLCTRPDAPSASAASARDLIVNAGAVLAAKKSLADPALSLESIARGLAPSMTAALAQDVAQRAAGLLQTGGGAGSARQRIAAYRTWNTLSAADAVSGIVVNPLSAETHRLWDEVVSKSFADQDAFSAALNDWLKSFDPGSPAPQEIVTLCEQLEAGLENRDTLFRRFLFGEDFIARLASYSELGTAGSVYKRAAALGIASQQVDSPEGRELARFLIGRTGIANADDAADLAGTGFDLTQAAFSGAGDLPLEYLCKVLLSSGSSMPASLLARLAASPAIRDEVTAFQTRLRQVRGFIPGFDESAQAYAQGLGGDFSSKTSLVASIEAGQWDDEFFAASAGGDYLTWYDGLTRSGLDAASQVILVELAQKSAVVSKSAATHAAEASYWRQVEQQSDHLSSWRSYLTEANVGSAQEVGTAPTAQTRDTHIFVRSTGDLSVNVALDAFNELAWQEGAMTAQLSADAGNGAALSKFHSFLNAFAAGTALETDLPAAEQGLAAAEGKYREALDRLEGFKDGILRFGEALGFLNLGTADLQKQLEALKQNVDSLAAVVSTRQAAADAALSNFQKSEDTYNRLYADLQQSSDMLEQSRFALRVREEIQDWASNGYLASNGEAAESYRSPAQSQSDAAAKLVRATAAVDALKDLYGSAQVTDRPLSDAATLIAYEGWKASYAQLLRLTRTVGELDEATNEQAKNVDAKFVTLQDARASVLNWKEADANLGTWSDDPAARQARAGNWASYLTVANGNLSLNISDGFTIQAQSTRDQWMSLKNFFETAETLPGDPPESAGKTTFERKMEAWLSTVGTLSARFGGMNGLIDRWGFAADYLKRRLYDNNGDAVRGLLTEYASDDKLIGPQELLTLKTDDGNYGDVARGYLNYALSIAQRKYVEVLNDPDERKAFGFYFAIRMAGLGTGNDDTFDQFNTRTTYMALNSFSRHLEDRARRIRDDGWFGWLNDLITGCNRRSDELRAINRTKVNPILSNLKYQTGSTLKSSISLFTSAKDDYGAGCARLAEMRGTNGAALASLDEFFSQYRNMTAQRQGVSADRVTVPSDLNSFFRSAWSRLVPADKSSFSAALKKMSDLANADVDEAYRRAALAAQTAQGNTASAQQSYRAAFDAFLAGSGTQAELAAAARRAYKDSPWVGKAGQEIASGVLDTASFSGGVLLTEAETSARISALRSYAQDILSAYKASLDSHGAALEQEWSQSVQDFGDRRQSWYSQVGLVQAKAASSWDASQQKLVRAWGQWRQGFQQEYAEKSEAWRLSYLNLGERKLEWVQAARVKAGQAGNEAILSEVGASADDSSRNASTLLIGTMSYDPRAATVKVEGLLGEVGSAQALTALRRMNAGIAQGTVVVASGKLGVQTSGAGIIAEARRFVQASRKELSALAARGLAEDARRSVEEAKKALAESVKQANEGFEKSMDEVFLSEGYAKSSGEYRREAIVRSTLFEYAKTESQDVGGYRWYALPALQPKVDLSPSRLGGLEAGAVIDFVGVAQEEVAGQQKKIFGEGKKLSEEEKKARGLLVSFSANATTVNKEMGEGEFGAHVGYAPEFTNEPDFDKSRDRNIVVSGKGELGRLMGDFIWNQMKESRGWDEMSKPAWDKPLWDDTGSWFKAPNLRSIGAIASGIAATVLTGGIGGIAGIAAAAAISTTSTVLFDTLDVVGGYKSWEEAGLDIGKSFLTSAATSTIGGVFNGFGAAANGATSTFYNTGIAGALGDFGKGVVGKTLLAGTQAFTTNVATSAISAVSWSRDGGLGWNTDAFTSGSFGKSAWASVAGAAGAAGTSTLLAGNLTGFRGAHAADVTSVANLAGSLASSGIQYGMTGEATLNVLNIGDMGSKWRYRLMEMHLGGDAGFGMNLGSSGTDVSVGNIGRAMAGMGTFVKQQQFNWYETFGGVQYAAGYSGSREVGTQLRENYSFGDAQALAQQERFLSGQDKLRVGYIVDEGRTTALGDSRLVDLATLGQKGNIASQLAAGIVMGHEAYRNGIDDGVLGQAYETQRAVLGHTLMASRVASEYGTEFIAQNANLSRDVAEYLKGPEAFARYVGRTYDSKADYWKLMENGSLKKDEDGWLRDSNGNYITDKNGNRIGADSIQGGLQNILGIVDPKIAAAVLKDSGFTFSENGYWNTPENDGKSIDLSNDEYRGLYEEKLDQYNTLTIYDRMVASGSMTLNGDGRPISYEDFKASNFITVMPRYSIGAGVPLDSPISALYGANGTRGLAHTGLDFAVPIGTPERSLLTTDDMSISADIRTSGGERSATGNYFTIDTKISYIYKGDVVTEDIFQRYLHQNEIDVKPGQRIIADTVLGLSGNTGYWNGPYDPHVHYDMYTLSDSPYLDFLSRQGNPYGLENKTARWDMQSGKMRQYYNPMLLSGFPAYPVRKNATMYNK